MKSLYRSFCALSAVICVVLMLSPGYEFEGGIAVLMMASSFMTALLVDMLEDMATPPRTAHKREGGRWTKRAWH
jgi:hypothetical protein